MKTIKKKVINKPNFIYTAIVVSCTDGDTCKFFIDLGFDPINTTKKIRLAKINAPEMKDKNPVIKAAAEASKAYLESLVLNKKVFYKSIKIAPGNGKVDEYGRYIAELYLTEFDTVSVNDMMVKAGHAVYQKY